MSPMAARLRVATSPLEAASTARIRKAARRPEASRSREAAPERQTACNREATCRRQAARSSEVTCDLQALQRGDRRRLRIDPVAAALERVGRQGYAPAALASVEASPVDAHAGEPEPPRALRAGPLASPLGTGRQRGDHRA